MLVGILADIVNMMKFEWDTAKDSANQRKHGIAFAVAQYAFADPNRVILADEEHSMAEERFYCLGKVDEGIMSVRFTLRNDDVIRIFGAGYWRKGKRIYEEQNQVHG